jgi:hypothetical protein
MNRESFVWVAVATALFLFGCGGTSVGRACTQDGDCDSGQTCFTDMPGGYCSAVCTTEGQRENCPSGSLCATSGLRTLCALECKVQEDCRLDYECNGLTGSSVKVCRPKIQ